MRPLQWVRQSFYLWVLFGIFFGGLVGFIAPQIGTEMKPLGDGFIALIRMLIGPIVFCTVVLGVCGAGDVKKIGRVGGKALLYFEVISTLALLLGLVVGHWFQPGAGFHVDAATLGAGTGQISQYVQLAVAQSPSSFLLHLIPRTFVDAFSGAGDLLQILLIALLFGIVLSRLPEEGAPVRRVIESVSAVFFGMVGIVMKLAPIGAGGAMAFTVGKYGLHSLGHLFYLMLCFYLTCIVFIGVVLGCVARICGFSILKFLSYIKSELFTVLATSSSESALAPLMTKLEALGCAKSVVGLVVPAGYSFNLDGTNIYLTLAVLFVAQAMGIDLSYSDQARVIGVAMLASKGASGVTGAGFVTLAATLAVVPKVPVAGLALLLGVDRFMSEARALTNIVGNGVATIVVCAWEGELDREKLRRALTKLS